MHARYALKHAVWQGLNACAGVGFNMIAATTSALRISNREAILL